MKMKGWAVLSLLLVLLLAGCQAAPLPTPVPPQAEARPGLQQQEEPAAEAAEELSDPALGQQLQAALEAAMASADTDWPGAVLHVRAPGLGAWSGAVGLGELATNTPMRPHDRFRGGSLTKPFVAVVVLQLVEEGRFGLDDPIGGLLPGETAGKFANIDRITVRTLLNHTSGLPDFMDLAGPEIVAQLGKVWTAEEFLDYAAAQAPWFAPGESQRYSNTGYLLLGMIIEEATGRTWREEVEQRIFEPLGLEDTLLPAPEETALPGDHAHGYANFGNGLFDATTAATASVVGAAGGQTLVTNAPDLATFMEALLAGQFFRESGTLDEMLSFVEVPPDVFPPGHPLRAIVSEYGLGLTKATYGGELTAIGHAGDTDGGYHGFVFRFPEQEITISGAVNTTDELAGWIRLMPRVLEVLAPGYTMPEWSAPAPQQPDAAAALQGLLDEQVRQQGILGMAMAVRLGDGTVVSESSGATDPAGENAWRPDTVSALGSITKSFVAVVMMQLVEEGKLAPDDTIDRWFPEQPNGDKITVRMLLSHTSGLANFISSENVMDPKWVEEWAPVDLVAEANRLGPVDEPGSSIAHYANTNYILLGLIIEAITGNNWKEEVRSRIIEPLGMQETSFASAEGVWGGTMTPGYFKTADGYASTLDVPYLHASTSGAAGEMVGSLEDLLTFAGALFDGELVSKESLAEMATPLGTDLDNGIVWGLGGATIEGMPGAFGNEGGIPGYSAFFMGVQDTQVVVATMLNTEGGDSIGPSLAALQYVMAAK